MKLLNSNLKSISAFCLMLIMFLNSGTLYFGRLHSQGSLIVYIIFLCVHIVIYNKECQLSKNNIKILAVILSCILWSVIGNLLVIDDIYITQLFNLVVHLILLFLTISVLKDTDIIKYYIEIMTIISIISLVCFSMYYLGQNLISLFSSYTYDENGNMYICAFYHNWGWTDLFYRNAGPFWEPGAYQIFLSLGVLLVIHFKNIIKCSRFKLLLFFITLITTRSTTAYFVIVLIFLFNINEIVDIILDKNKKYKNLMILVFSAIMTIAFYYIMHSDVVIQKFNGYNQQSFFTRRNDLYSSFKLIWKSPIFGMGFGQQMHNAERMMGINNNSVGLLYYSYVLGIPFMLIYARLYLDGLVDFFNISKIKDYVLFILVFLMFWTTEGLLFIFILNIFIFKTKREAANVEKSNKPI